jgi:FdhD protein
MSDVPPRPVTARLTPVSVQRVGRDREDSIQDLAAVEEPLEVRLHGQSFSVIMRTPGDDRALTAGFLLSEGVVTGTDDLGAVEHCKHPDHPEAHNIVDVYLHGPAASGLPRLLDERRNVVTNSSCGMCGRVTIESLQRRLRRVDVTWTMKREVVATLPDRLRERQITFAETGGLHAAGLFQQDGRCDLMAEDVGRHNAVDKVIGAMVLADRLPLGDYALVVSGRTSFEIVQKAWVAGIAIVCAVSAPSSLAIALAREAGITLLGFVRDGGFNVYSHPHRIDSRD